MESITRPKASLSMAIAFTLAIVGIGVGLLLRVQVVTTTDFPIVDGGLFYTMVQDLKATHYALPVYTSYNGGTIPFVYPPLGLYLAAAASIVLQWSLADLFRLLPLLYQLLTVGAFLLLSRALLKSVAAQLFATAAFALMPSALYWPIMGGGVARGLGFLLGILTLRELSLLYRHTTIGRTVSTGLLGGLTALSHPTMATTTAFGALILFMAHGRSRRGVAGTLASAALAFAVTLPWVLRVAVNHGGLSPLLTGVTNGNRDVEWMGLWTFLFPQRAGLEFSMWTAALAAAGVAVSLIRDRSVWLPAWLVVGMVFMPRVPMWSASVPEALLAGVGAEFLLTASSLPAVRGAEIGQTGAAHLTVWNRWLTPSVAATVLLGVAVIGNSLSLQAAIGRLWSLPPSERTAMEWVKGNTPADGRFALVTGVQPSVDAAAEWFPTLAMRESVTTHQGHEWLGDSEERSRQHIALQACADQGTECLGKWADQFHMHLDYLYVAQRQDGATSMLTDSLRTDPAYVREYQGPGAVIFRRLQGPKLAGN